VSPHASDDIGIFRQQSLVSASASARAKTLDEPSIQKEDICASCAIGLHVMNIPNMSSLAEGDTKKWFHFTDKRGRFR